ncbi:flagellar biosynthesis protein FlhB [Xenophilus sp.]|uniref:flagellar biosynthesis protein FlhB n=1 Tax=Xenophilus sp. TaxID=1873499 RepID=UPI0037DCB312
MSEQDLDRSEAATPFKLRRAREKGQAARSTDAVGAVVFAVAAAYLGWKGADELIRQFVVDRAVLIHAARASSPQALWSLIAQGLQASLLQLAPFFGALMLAAVCGNVMQTGPMLSFEPLKADFNRLNPAQGFKKIFSMRVLFDGARACVKLVVLLGVAFLALRALAHQFFALAALSPWGYARALVDDLSSLAFKMALVMGIVALVDWVYTRREFAKKMRMSRRELKDEIKQREGDPRIRARLRELRLEALKRSKALRKTRDADVLVVNPTHLAIALKYEHGRMSSPQLLAKGAGHMAAAMRDVAARHGIPVVRNAPLARELFRSLPVDSHVPPQLYAQVARIIVWVLAMREQRGAPRPSGGAA